MNQPYRTTQLGGITDLTLIAPIKPGLIQGGLETGSYTERLRRTLATLDAVRKRARESRLTPSPFPDPVGRLRGIHFFRYAILPARQAPLSLPEPDRLILNVTFDGGWEPYMRMIWGPIGALLDLIFCHCVDYPLAHASSFDDYMRWVRRHEIPADFFYADGPATVGDRRYHAALEALVEREADRPGIAVEIARLAVPPSTPATPPGDLAARNGLALLAALDALRPLYPRTNARANDDAVVLLRFAQDLLRELRDWVREGRFDPNGPYGSLRPPVAGAVGWLMTPRAPSQGKDRRHFDRAQVQAGIADPLPAAGYGCLGLFAVADRARALSWLEKVPVTTGNVATLPAGDDDHFLTLALTFAGLRAIGVPEWRLARLPQEFIDGMEARASVLGDVRVNHPEQWTRPRMADGTVLDLRLVHLTVQLRTAARPDEAESCVHQRLRHALERLETHGLILLATQDMASRADPGQPPRGHLGFADGISQPRLADDPAPRVYWSDKVRPGELFCGYLSARDRQATEPIDGDDGDLLMDDGSFVVVRKLRQHLDRMYSQLERQARAALPPSDPGVAALAENYLQLMMGRKRDGTPLAALRADDRNDFDYRADPRGDQCPFASHVRRINPRETDPDLPLPRIARRGMSYGSAFVPAAGTATEDDRGLVFIAWCASIAEQFEVLQRWAAGGNASGVSSAQNDPFLGLPEPGRRRVFRCTIQGRAHTVDLGSEPWVTLQWGLYAFAPSPRALQRIRAIVDSKRVQPDQGEPASALADFEAWRARLEDRNQRDATWAAVKASGGVMDAGSYGVLVADPKELLDVLRDTGCRYSARGYGDRMRASIGLGFLGQDDVCAHAGHAAVAPAVNEVIEAFAGSSQAPVPTAREGIYRDAAGAAAHRLSAILAMSRPWTVDLQQFAGGVVAALCHAWFGLPDAQGRFMTPGAGPAGPNDPASCPGSFMSVSRYLFSSPHPSPELEQLAQGQGKIIRERVGGWLADTVQDPRRRGPLTQAVLAALPAGSDLDLQTRTLAGVMLGFPPTVLGNLVGVLVSWARSGKLWELQLALKRAAPDDTVAVPFAVADGLLAAPVLDTMALAPVPYAIWRMPGDNRPASLGDIPIRDADTRLVLGLGAAAGQERMLMFGGQRGDTVHACPGYAMAMGVMVGVLAALMRPTVRSPRGGRLSLRPGDGPTTLRLVD